MHRKSLAGATTSAVLLIAALLTGCSSEPTSESADTSQSESTQSQQTTGGEIEIPNVDRNYSGPLPEITLPTEAAAPIMKPVSGEPPKQITVTTLEPGKSKEAVGPDDYITVNYAGWLWDGEQFDSSFTNIGQPAPISFSLNQVIQGWKWGLTDTKVGDQVMVVIPPEYGYGFQDTASIPSGSTLVFYVEILESVSVNTDVLDDAKATDAAVPSGMTIVGEPGVAPEVTFDRVAEMPSEDQTIVLAEGSGPVVADDEAVQYLVTVGYWGSSERAQTWEDGVQMVDPGSVLAGQRVGSRVLIVSSSPDEATPASFVIVDILAAHPVR